MSKIEKKMVRKALIVKPEKRSDWDIGDVLALARSIGKKLLKTDENVRVLWSYESPYGHVVIIEGCTQLSGCKGEEINEKTK
jgi:hypothetical protein